MSSPNEIDPYIAGFPPEVQKPLRELRKISQKAAPEATESLSYQMPAYRMKGMLLYFAAHKNHIGFYPTAGAIEAYKEELSPYKWAKGTVRFPFGQALPEKLIEKMARFRLQENLNKL